eukprot:4384473-Pleurochrysis_carterae.AAC.1
MFEHVLGPSVSSRAEKTHCPPHELIRVTELLCVRGGHVGQAHDVFSVAYWWRSAVGCRGSGEEPGDRKG